jgi:hypothetical protein
VLQVFDRKKSATLVLLAALCLQFLLFRQFCLREIIPVFPRAYDQTGYLGISYDIFEAIREGGLRAGLTSVRQSNAPQGILLQVEGALAQFVEGPGRLAALQVNFAHLVLFEIALFAIACWIGRPVVGLALCGLLISAGTIYPTTGGMPDFRLDFAALCLFGAVICLAIRSAFFRHAGWTLLFALAVGVLILTRSIYLVHLAPGLGLLFLALLLGRKRRPDLARARLVNMTMAGVVIALISLPSLLLRWDVIRAYYASGHFASGEGPLRAREVGITSTLEALTFYLRSVFKAHAGGPFLILAALLVVALLIRARASRAQAETRSSATPSPDLLPADLRLGLAWLGITAMTVYAVLTVDVSKSPVVGDVFIGIFVPSLLLLSALVGDPPRAFWRMAVCVLVFLLGHGVFVSHMVRRAEIAPEGADMREYGRIMDTIGRVSRDYGLVHPMVSFDALTEFTHVSVVKAMAYERLGLPLTPAAGLGGIEIGLRSIAPAAADDLLTRSDFALLGNDRDPNEPELYPINATLRRLSPHLYERASREMIRVDEGTFFGRRLTLFVKPQIACIGESGGWMTSAGIECRTLGAMLERRPVLRLAGDSNFDWLGSTPAVTAEVTQDGEAAPIAVACQVDVGAAVGSSRPYAITCNARHLTMDPEKPVRVRVSFDRAFVPRERGINEDTRHLVLRWPRTIDTLPAPE